jgi:hypothetical protein
MRYIKGMIIQNRGPISGSSGIRKQPCGGAMLSFEGPCCCCMQSRQIWCGLKSVEQTSRDQEDQMACNSFAHPDSHHLAACCGPSKPQIDSQHKRAAAQTHT